MLYSTASFAGLQGPRRLRPSSWKVEYLEKPKRLKASRWRVRPLHRDTRTQGSERDQDFGNYLIAPLLYAILREPEPLQFAAAGIWSQSWPSSIVDLFGAWYRKGGSLRRVGEEVAAACAECEPENLRLAEAERDALLSGLARLFREHLAGFMQAHEITKDVARYVPDAGALLALTSPRAETEKMIASEIGETAGTMAAVAASVGPLVAATVHAKLIILLAIAHPLLAALAGVGSLAAYLGIGRSVGSAVQDAVKDHEFNALTLGILHITLSEAGLAKKLAEGRRAAEADLRRAIVESLKGDDEAGAPGLVERATAAFDAMLGSVVAISACLNRSRECLSFCSGIAAQAAWSASLRCA